MESNHDESLLLHKMSMNAHLAQVTPDWVKEEVSTGVSMLFVCLGFDD